MGMSVLKALGRLGGIASLTAIAAEVGEMPPKVHRYLASLLQEGLVVQEQASQRYQLGPEVIQLGLAAMRLSDPVRVVGPALMRLRESLELTCILAVMGNMGPTIVRWEEPQLAATVNVRVGSVLSVLWSASGRVFLAYSGDERVRQLAMSELERATPEQRALLDRRRPIDHLSEEVRAAGCAVAADTLITGMTGVAVPVFDFTGRLSAAIAALGTAGTIDPSYGGATASALKAEAASVSRALGYVPA